MNTPPPLPRTRTKFGDFILYFGGASSIVAATYVVRHPAISEYVRPPAPFAVIFYIAFLIGPSVLAFVTLGEALVAHFEGAKAKFLYTLAGLASASSLFLFPVDEHRFGRDLGALPMLTASTVSLLFVGFGHFSIRKKK